MAFICLGGMCCPPFFVAMMPEDYSLSNAEKAVSFQQISSLVDSIAAESSKLPQVVAVALSGSQTSDISDDWSDLDCGRRSSSRNSL